MILIIAPGQSLRPNAGAGLSVESVYSPSVEMSSQKLDQPSLRSAVECIGSGAGAPVIEAAIATSISKTEKTGPGLSLSESSEKWLALASWNARANDFDFKLAQLKLMTAN